MLNKIILGGLTLLCLVNIVGSTPLPEYSEILDYIESAINAETRQLEENRAVNELLRVLEHVKKSGSRRPIGYGMTAELVNKIAAKYDEGRAQEALAWIHDVLLTEGSDDNKELASQLEGLAGADNFGKVLKDGVILCKLINIIKPGSVRKINTSKMAFKMMGNIGNFLDACKGYGLVPTDLFQTADLYEANNIPAVVNALFALGRRAQNIGYNGPSLGLKEAAQNDRKFTEEQLRAGEGVTRLQAGSNKGASQAGQNFGKTRLIID